VSFLSWIVQYRFVNVQIVLHILVLYYVFHSYLEEESYLKSA